MDWVPFPDSRLQVCGLPWVSETTPNLWRFPERMKDGLPETLFDAGRQTAGVRIRMRTNTGALSLRAKFPKFSIRTNMTMFTAHGISTYVNGQCWSARIPGADGGDAELLLFDGVAQEMREICLYLPLYGSVEVLEVGVDEGAAFETPAPFAVEKPVVFYGTSITQGGCASRPGLSYQAMLTRALNLDYANYGFSGKGKCERVVAERLAEIDAGCYVLDVGQNSSVEEMEERFQPFLEVLREGCPEVPLLATTPIFYNAELWSTGFQAGVGRKREIIRSSVQVRQEAGDKGVFLLEAKDYLSGEFSDGAVDGGHPNDLGFERMANSMRPVLAKILKVG